MYGAEALGGIINVITKLHLQKGGSATVAVGNQGAKRDVSYGTKINSSLVSIEDTGGTDHPRRFATTCRY